MRNWVWKREEILKKQNQEIAVAIGRLESVSWFHNRRRRTGIYQGRTVYCLYFTSLLLAANQISNFESSVCVCQSAGVRVFLWSNTFFCKILWEDFLYISWQINILYFRGSRYPEGTRDILCIYLQQSVLLLSSQVKFLCLAIHSAQWRETGNKDSN